MLNTSLAISLVVVSVWSCLMVNACCVILSSQRGQRLFKQRDLGLGEGERVQSLP